MTNKEFAIYIGTMIAGIALEVIAAILWIVTKQDALSKLIMAIVFGLFTGCSVFTVISDIVRRKRNNR